MPERTLPGKRETLNPILSRSFVLCAAITVVAGCSLVVGARRIVNAERTERHNYEAIGRLEEARASMRSAVSNMRAFMLTADSVHQQACMSDVDDAREDVNQFSEIVDQFSSATKLQTLMSTSSSRMADLMNQRAEGGPTLAAKLADDPQLAESLGDVENGIAGLLTSQSNLIDVRREKRQDDFLLTEIAFLVTIISGFLSLILAAVSLKKESWKRRVAEAQHASAKQDLLTIQSMLDLSDQKDELSGLLNREAFKNILNQEYEKNRKNGLAISVLIVHLDQLLQVRETLGAAAADEVLRKAAGLLKDCFRGGDVLCRYGDTEFAVILPRTNLQNATIAAERARGLLEQTDWSGCNITGSFGVAQADFLKDRNELVSRAEQAVDYARRTGRNRVTAIRAYLPLSA